VKHTVIAHKEELGAIKTVVATSTVRGIYVEADCVWCKGTGNFDHTTEDGGTLKCPVSCTCNGTGRMLTKVTMKDFVQLLKFELEKKTT